MCLRGEGLQLGFTTDPIFSYLMPFPTTLSLKLLNAILTYIYKPFELSIFKSILTNYIKNIKHSNNFKQRKYNAHTLFFHHHTNLYHKLLCHRFSSLSTISHSKNYCSRTIYDISTCIYFRARTLSSIIHHNSIFPA